jgi:hypothetical protein
MARYFGFVWRPLNASVPGPSRFQYLCIEIGATVLVALAVGIWIARKRNG